MTFLRFPTANWRRRTKTEEAAVLEGLTGGTDRNICEGWAEGALSVKEGLQMRRSFGGTAETHGELWLQGVEYPLVKRGRVLFNRSTGVCT